MTRSSIVVLDTSTLTGPGSDRGLGRYATAVESAASTLTIDLRPAGSEREVRAALRNARGAVVYHALSPSTMLPGRPAVPTVCSVLDCIPLDVAGYTRLGFRTRLAYRRASRATVLLPLSDFTLRRFRVHFPASRQASYVSPLPIEEVFSHSPGGRTRSRSSADRFVFALADARTPDPRKRNSWLLDLSNSLLDVGLSMRIGGRGTNPWPDAKNIVWIEDMSDSDLRRNMESCVGMFYPSAYEGQGMPPLEALRVGCPVLAFANSAISEMIVDPEFLMKDPLPWERARGVQDVSLPAATAAATAATFSDWAALSAADREALRARAARAVNSSCEPGHMASALLEAYGTAVELWRE